MVGITIIEDTIVLNIINRHNKLLDIPLFESLKENENINININNIEMKGVITSISSNYVEKEIFDETIKLVEKTIAIQKL